MSSAKCMQRLNDGSFCKRYASAGTRFCSHHQGSYAHLQHDDPTDIHPLARLTTPEDLFDLLRETLNAARLGRIAPAQACAVAVLAREWRKAYQELTMLQRNMALHRQILSGLMLDETEIAAERAEAPHPLPIRVDEEATINHITHTSNPAAAPSEHVSTYPGWIEQEGRRKGDRPQAPGAVTQPLTPSPSPLSSSPPPPQPVAASPAPDLQSALQDIESQLAPAPSGPALVPSVPAAPVNGSGTKPHASTVP